MKEVNKNIGENLKNVKRVRFNLNKGGRTYQNGRMHFMETLRHDGNAVYSHGGSNYITADRNNEHNVFFFSAHNPDRTNYLVPVNLKYNTNYFVFYDSEAFCAYIVSYGKVREYCKNITDAIWFGDGESKMLIPDSWVKEQKLNTYKMWK